MATKGFDEDGKTEIERGHALG